MLSTTTRKSTVCVSLRPPLQRCVEGVADEWVVPMSNPVSQTLGIPCSQILEFP